MTKIEKGMYVKLLKDLVFYDPYTFVPTVVATKEEQGEIVYVGMVLTFTMKNELKKQVLEPVVNVKIKGKDVQFAGPMLTDFAEYFEIL